jgi:hypothetical protein
MSQEVPGRLPEEMPERMLDEFRRYEDMPDRTPEDIPK